MDRQEIEKDFKIKLALILKDLKNSGIKDNQTMMLIGLLAGQLIDPAGVNSWTDLKAATTKGQFFKMIEALKSEGEKLHKAGDIKAAYAVQAVSLSLVANTMNDADTKKGNEFLDVLINQAYIFSKTQKTKKNS